MDERDASRERSVPAAHDLSESRLPAHHETIEDWVVEWLALHWQMPAGSIDTRRPLVEQGLDSMAAISLANDLEQWLGLPLTLAFLWQQGTIEALARVLASPEVMLALSPVSEAAEVVRRNEGTTPASLGQQQLWRQLRPQPESPRFHLHFGLRFDGPLDVEALKLSLQEIVRRHEAFRTSFREREGELLQVVAPAPRLEMPVVDLRAEQEDDAGRALDSASFRTLYDALGRAPFDLQVGPLIRTALVVLTHQTHVLLVTQHRLITDGASLSVFGRELAFLYRVFHARVPSPLAPPSRQAADVARWQRQWLGCEGAHRQREYWRARLEGVPPLKLTPRNGCGEGSRLGGLVSFEVPVALTAAWKALASGEGATLFTALSAVFAALLRRHSGQEDVLLGTVVANRGRRELRDVVGLLANTVALRCDLTGNPSFRELLVRHRRCTTEDLSHQELPFEEVSRLCRGARAALPEVQAACVFESMATFDLAIPGLGCTLLTDTPDASVPGTARHELTLLLREDLGRLSGAFEYAADVFQPAEVERLAECFRRLLGRIVETPDVRLDDLPLAEETLQLG
ncbi:condensation domain-containing protein [Myxococcus stipitatus]|uniref:condensation domain-containing protein n=1 Tax=Myxococcus stipitatus TaxID=83455 RepID=UPI001469A836|nr:condensation domain-containing protein [Myxococcus stipitatus]